MSKVNSFLKNSIFLNDYFLDTDFYIKFFKLNFKKEQGKVKNIITNIPNQIRNKLHNLESTWEEKDFQKKILKEIMMPRFPSIGAMVFFSLILEKKGNFKLIEKFLTEEEKKNEFGLLSHIYLKEEIKGKNIPFHVIYIFLVQELKLIKKGLSDESYSLRDKVLNKIKESIEFNKVNNYKKHPWFNKKLNKKMRKQIEAELIFYQEYIDYLFQIWEDSIKEKKLLKEGLIFLYEKLEMTKQTNKLTYNSARLMNVSIKSILEV